MTPQHPHSRRRSAALAAAATAAAWAAAAGTLWSSSSSSSSSSSTHLGSASTVACLPVPLLGGKANWRVNDWRQVSDGVRGGASKGELRGAASIDGVQFSGCLDPAAAPGGRGFAGVTFRADALPKSLAKGLRGLCVDVAECDGLEYSLSLAMRGSAGGLCHRIKFCPSSPGPIEMPFKEFEGVTKAFPAPPPPPLELERVDSLTLQIETDKVRKQEGSFSLLLHSISGLLGDAGVAVDPLAGLSKWICKACDCMNPPAGTSCMRCGAAKRVEEMRQLEKAKAWARSQPATKWKCLGCDAKNFATSTECMKCGATKDW